MTIDEVIEKAGRLSKEEAIVMSAKLIADAIDRHSLSIDRQTEVQQAGVKVQLKMAGFTEDVFKEITSKMNDIGDIPGEEWKKGKQDDD